MIEAPEQKTNEASVMNEYSQLEDERIKKYLSNHNTNLYLINEFKLDDIGSYQLAKVEYLYSKCMLYASLIAGHYRKQQKYYEAMAEIHQADAYENARTSDTSELKGSTDGQYLSRKAKGEQLIKAAQFEGDYIRWQGITKSYESSINSIKDMIKSLEKEGKGGV
jgi:hypothetical protein